MAFTLALTALAATAHAQPADTLGVYAGAGAPDKVGSFEHRLGRQVGIVHDTIAKESWSALTDVDWWLTQWGSTRYAQRVVYTIPMLPDSGGTLAEGAGGDYNEYFRTLAQKLVAGGQGAATLRLGPEFNGNWFKWSIGVPNGGADFAAYWRQIVDTMRSVPGADFKFDWCPNDGSSYVDGQQLKAASAWPGDAYVDYVGLDVYDQSWAAHRANPAARWKEYLNQPDGLRWHRAFAANHGKPMTFPEWGIAVRSDGYGGGDNPYFVGQMYEWIRTNNVAYHLYFEHADDNADYALFGGKVPNSARRFVQLFGGRATGAPLDSLGKRCATRVLKRRGKAVRRKGKLVRKTICIKKAGKKARRTKTVAKRKTGSLKPLSARTSTKRAA